MKNCTYCAEEIQDAAIKCRYCHEFLDDSKRPLPPALLMGAGAGDGLPWYFRTSFLVLLFVSAPPLMLPLLWLHPKLHVAWKAAVTLAVAGFCWVAYIAFKGFVSQFEEATKMMNEALNGM